MRPERLETLHKQAEVSLDREQFWLVTATYEPERLVKFQRQSRATS